MFIHDLEKLLPNQVSFEEPILLAHATDLWARSLILKRLGQKPNCPQAVVRPTTIEDIQTLVKWANQNHVALIPYGGGSGVCGAVNIKDIAVTVDLKQFNKIIQLNEVSQWVQAQCGILGPDLEKALNQKNFTLNHFPASFHISTLGGWISTRAAGQFSTAYGSIEEMVLGLKVVLPDGQLLDIKSVPRRSTGPSLQELFLGAEAALGIIVESTLQIHQLPNATHYVAYSFKDISLALEAVRKMIQMEIKPAVVRLYDELDTQVASSEMGTDISGNLLVLVFQGDHKLITAQMEISREILNQKGLDLGEKPAQHWWDHRFDLNDKRLTQVLSSEGMILDTIEVATTWDHLESLYHEMKKAMSGDVMVLAHFSHVYITGASIYFTFIGNVGDEHALKKYDEIWQGAMQACLQNHGTISHHHGIGEVRKEWIKKELGNGWEVLSKIKHILDPNNILNPGKWL